MSIFTHFYPSPNKYFLPPEPTHLTHLHTTKGVWNTLTQYQAALWYQVQDQYVCTVSEIVIGTHVTQAFSSASQIQTPVYGFQCTYRCTASSPAHIVHCRSVSHHLRHVMAESEGPGSSKKAVILIADERCLTPALTPTHHYKDR